MTCPKTDELLTALHCGEPAEPHCSECRRTLGRERRFISMIEEGLRRSIRAEPEFPTELGQLRRALDGEVARTVSVLVSAAASGGKDEPARATAKARQAKPKLWQSTVRRFWRM